MKFSVSRRLVVLLFVFLSIAFVQKSGGFWGSSDDAATPTPTLSPPPPSKSAEGAKEMPASNLPQPLPLPKDQPKFVAEVLTTIGVNSGAVFSDDGKKIFYVSSARPAHAHPQAYLMDLETKREQRLTHQDGEVQAPLPINNGSELLYASTTDEIKENPQILREFFEPEAIKKEGESMWRFLPFELYLANADGLAIRRLTQRPGFDAEAAVSKDSQTVYYSSLVNGNLQIYRMKLAKGQPQLLIKANKKHLTQPMPSPDGKRLAWVELSSEQDRAQIFVGDDSGLGGKAVTKGEAINWAPSWHPSEAVLVFTSNHIKEGAFEIFTLNLEKNCLSRWTYHQASDTLPTFSPDGKSIMFTSDRSGRKQIYRTPYTSPSTCTSQETP